MKINYYKKFLNSKIFIAGHKGMVGIATYNQALLLGFRKKKYFHSFKKKTKFN